MSDIEIGIAVVNGRWTGALLEFYNATLTQLKKELPRLPEHVLILMADGITARWADALHSAKKIMSPWTDTSCVTKKEHQ